jgi:hypothetical protein
MAARKAAKKTMARKTMKKTRGGAVNAFLPAPQPVEGLLVPAVQKVREASSRSQ